MTDKVFAGEGLVAEAIGIFPDRARRFDFTGGDEVGVFRVEQFVIAAARGGISVKSPTVEYPPPAGPPRISRKSVFSFSISLRAPFASIFV